MDNNYKFLVRVSCMTYNQHAYITDAMNGFVMQQTNFPFVCTIIDDASTDGEQEVIKKFVNDNFDLQNSSVAYEKDTNYGHVTFAQHKTNKNCYFAVIYLNENHYSQRKSKAPYLTEWMDTKYIALCEGDDYWIDPLKLQKQVDFLEGHEDYSVCCHECMCYYQNENMISEDESIKKMLELYPNGFTFSKKDNLNTWIARTLTIVYRFDCIDEDELAKYRYLCDVHNCYHLLKKGKGFCLPFIGAVYRICDSGVYSGLSEKDKLVRWSLIRSELVNCNLEDEDLRDNVFFGVRRYLYDHEICKELFGVMAACVKSFFYSDGLRGFYIACKKMMKSYVNGFGRK